MTFPHLSRQYNLSKDVQQALQLDAPIVALESAVITHGLPAPENHQTASAMEAVVRQNGAAPATIALLDGVVHIGLTKAELEDLADRPNTRKISLRDVGIALANGLSGGTTVATTLFFAAQAGIKVFATGGIGGVHRDAPFDISADLPQLAKSQVLVVCAGAKTILDLPATLENLETRGIPVIGYQTDEFPAFYSRESGLKVDWRVDTPHKAAEIAQQAWGAGLKGAVLLVVPPPAELALPIDKVESAIQEALSEAKQKAIHGAAMTPFLLNRVSELTGGESLQANLALLKNNAKVAAQVASAMGGIKKIGPF